jgi:CheY-like chemotaxis protein
MLWTRLAPDPMNGGGMPMDETQVRVRVCRDEAMQDAIIDARVTVTDDGEGIEPEHLVDIMQPFFTTKAEGKGTGLGLYSTLGIVQQLNGYLDVESSPGVGTKFSLFFPRAEEPPVAEFNEPEQQPAAGRGESVLVVDDDEMLLELTTSSLRDAGYRTMAANSPEAALAMLRQGQEVDLLLTDVIMPNINGLELATCCREARPNLKVLYMSGYSDDILEKRVLRDELEFLAKPFKLSVLQAKIRSLLDD